MSNDKKSCFGCAFLGRNLECKLNVERDEMRQSCVFFHSNDDFVKNERTARTITKSKKVIIELFKDKPEEFISDVLGYELKWYQKLYIKNIFKKYRKTNKE